MRIRELQGPRDDSKGQGRTPGIHRRTWKAHKDHRIREFQALEQSSQNFPVPIPAPQGTLEVLQQQFGNVGSGRSISMEKRSPGMFAVPVDNSIPRLDP